MSVQAYIMMNVKTGAEGARFAILKFGEVEEVAVIYSKSALIVKVKAKDMNNLDKLIVDKMRSISDILLTATMLIAKEYK